MATIEIDHITKVYGNGFVAVQDVSLSIRDGEFIVLVGPSGCGKSTLLRMIAGLEDVSAGSVLIGDRDVTDLAPRHRDIAMVFQSYALYPHLTVRQNLGYGLKVRKTPKDEIARRVDAVARTLGLSELLDRRPAQLSGGQRQRVAMGRAIVREPRAFLMDEPLSNLDAKLRVGMRASLAQLHTRLGVTTIYVTHDQTEAMTLGQRVAVMRDGRIVQVDEPQQLYNRPANLFVAAFIGSPAMNLVEANLSGSEVVFGPYRVPVAPERRPAGVEGRVVLGIRPEAFEDGAFAPRSSLASTSGSTCSRSSVPTPTRSSVSTRPDPRSSRSSTSNAEETLVVGESTLFNGRVDPRTAARAGDPLTLAVDPSQFQFFDAVTGDSLLFAAQPASSAI